MKYLNAKTALTALVLAMGAPALTACSDGPPAGDVEQTGTMTAALLTSGSDGAIYQFPAGTQILLSKPGFNASFPLDGGENFLTVQLPTGTYDVQLQFPNGTSQLNRTAGGVTTLVDATWLDLRPMAIPIGTDMFTDLTLHFRVSGLGDLSFDMGSLVIALDVQRSATTQPAQLFESGTYSHAFHLFGSTATAGLQTYLADSGQSHAHFLDFNVLGPWTQRDPQQLCTSVQLDAFTTEDGESGFSRATNLDIGQIGSLCIVDRGANDQFFVNAAVSGPAPVALQDILPNGNYSFFLGMSGFIGDVYDGKTFLQSRLENYTSINGGVIAHQIYDFTIPAETMYQEGFVSGSMRLVP